MGLTIFIWSKINLLRIQRCIGELMLILRIKWTNFCLHISLAESDLDTKFQDAGYLSSCIPMTITVFCLADNKLINSESQGCLNLHNDIHFLSHQASRILNMD